MFSNFWEKELLQLLNFQLNIRDSESIPLLIYRKVLYYVNNLSRQYVALSL